MKAHLVFQDPIDGREHSIGTIDEPFKNSVGYKIQRDTEHCYHRNRTHLYLYAVSKGNGSAGG